MLLPVFFGFFLIENTFLQFLEAGCSVASVSCASHPCHGESYWWLHTATSRQSLAWGTQELSAENAELLLWNCVCHCALQETRDGVTAQSLLSP